MASQFPPLANPHCTDSIAVERSKRSQRACKVLLGFLIVLFFRRSWPHYWLHRQKSLDLRLGIPMNPKLLLNPEPLPIADPNSTGTRTEGRNNIIFSPWLHFLFWLLAGVGFCFGALLIAASWVCFMQKGNRDLWFPAILGIIGSVCCLLGVAYAFRNWRSLN